MSAGEFDLVLLRQWVDKAENDLKAASQILKLKKEAPTDTVCFHAQQCIEKYLKALLVFRGASFPKTHDLVMISELMPKEIRPETDETLLERLTDYATVSRYPGEADDITLTEARKAVAVARRVRKEIRRRLPRAALRRK